MEEQQLHQEDLQPDRLQLYGYQKECLQRAKERNTIVSLPTNRGKTLIAARVIEEFLHRYPGHKIAFLVPTRSLVNQQAKYCEHHCRLSDNTPPRVLKIVGEAQAGWGQEAWNEGLSRNHIVLGTPAVFEKAVIIYKFLDINQFSLLVFDECHEAVGNSKYAAIMRDAVGPYLHSKQREVPSSHSKVGDTNGNDMEVDKAEKMAGLPRVLGLTASIVHGKVKGDAAARRRDLERILLSTVLCPDISSFEQEDERTYYAVEYQEDEFHIRWKDPLAVLLEQAISNMKVKDKECKKAVKKCTHVFTELGVGPMLFYLQHSIIENLEKHLQHLGLLTDDEHAIRKAKSLKASLPQLKKDVEKLSGQLRTNIGRPDDVPTSKLLRLMELLQSSFEQSEDEGHRGIVFVQQIALLSPLAKAINDRFKGEIMCGCVAGSKAQLDSDRQETMEAFEQGHLQVLVATNAIEEGYNVPECKFVVRFNYIPNTKSHIQGSGRARHTRAEIYYFENNPEWEKRKETAMLAVAKDRSLEIDDDELEHSMKRMSSSLEGKHPYPFDGEIGGKVTVSNCKDIFVLYCSSVLGCSVNPLKDLYQYDQSSNLLQIRYPTPAGWMNTTVDDYKTFWNGVNIQELFSNRLKKRTQAEREELCFLYLVVVTLRERSLLNVNNQATETCQFEIKRKCYLEPDLSASLSLKDKISMGRTPESSPSNKSQQAPTNIPAKTSNIPLEQYVQVLQNYVDYIFDEKMSLIDEIFQYDTSGGTLSPVGLRYPVPAGWVLVGREAADGMFGDMSISDQLSPGCHKTKREELEIALSYVAVFELQKSGYIKDDDFTPNMLRLAREETVKNCPLKESIGVVHVNASPLSDTGSEVTTDMSVNAQDARWSSQDGTSDDNMDL